jgi:hypothetical protein
MPIIRLHLKGSRALALRKPTPKRRQRMFRSKLIAATLGAALALGTAGPVYAGSDKNEEM